MPVSELRTYLSRVKKFGAKRLRAGRIRVISTGSSFAPRVFKSRKRFYTAYRPDWEFDFSQHPEIRNLAERWVENNEQNNSGDIPRLYALVLNISQVMSEEILGDFAELGVYRCNSAAVLSHYSHKYDRSLFLFDTFTGFDKRDVLGVDEKAPGAFTDTSLELVRSIVGGNQVSFVKGFFPETVTDDIAARQFAVVHLDCDLYEPMKAGLNFFYPRLSLGGLIILHDYSNPHWAGAKQAIDEYLCEIEENLILTPDKSGTAMLRKAKPVAIRSR